MKSKPRFSLNSLTQSSKSAKNQRMLYFKKLTKLNLNKNNYSTESFVKTIIPSHKRFTNILILMDGGESSKS